MDDPDYDSDDLEFSPPPPNPDASAGARAIQAIRNQASQLRIDSKKAVKQLQSVNGAPMTRVQRAHWTNVWNVFRVEVLKKSADTMPVAEEIERFIMSIPSFISSSYDRDELSWSGISTALKYVVHAIRCKHDAFRFTYNDQQRLKDSIKSGTTDWSIVVQKCLGLALQSALACRVGDASISRGYDDNECITFKDILLKAKIDPQVSDDFPLLDRVSFEAKVKLRYTKGFKRDGSHNLTVLLVSLDDVEYNVVDPLKLLLAHALRHDSVQGATTVDNAVQRALARSGNLIEWKYPDRPVLCALTHKRLDYARGAKAQQLQSTLKEAGAVSGISHQLQCHDIRRGAALEHAQLGGGLNYEASRQALGHSYHSLQNGVTEKYVGYYNTKAALAERIRLEPPDSLGLQTVAEPATTSQKRRKVLTTDIDAYLTLPENAEMHKLKRPRHAATRAINKKRNESSADELPTEADADLEDVETRKRKVPLQQRTPSQMNVGSRHTPIYLSDDDDAETNENAPQLVISSTKQFRSSKNATDKTTVKTETNMDDSPEIDHRLLLLSGISGQSSSEDSMNAPERLASTQAVETVLDEMGMDDNDDSFAARNDSERALPLNTAAGAEIRILQGPASKFVAWLSQINTRVVNDTNPAQHADLDHLRGGSRDEPSFFVHHCRYESEGCTFATTVGPSVARHEGRCTAESRQSEAAKTFSEECDEPDCSYVARGDSRKNVSRKMKRHRESVHPDADSLLTCPIGGRPQCADKFVGSVALQRHKSRYHNDITSQRCPVAGCKIETLWTTPVHLYDHLRSVHKLAGTDASDVMAIAKAKKASE
ncbi:hypothetical protein B9Z65_6878 [Elsinoe australis]|uniref:C2H2-type domain-containing protein n=1 Tax=Elsinoe australis TaxID=40998 RepID=A0A2P7Z3Z6_9PEZI|nr:hypothetical protein B9Z65_6878 [Elsinoe australis]